MLFLAGSLLSGNVYANEDKCFIKGKVILPDGFLKESMVSILDQNSSIDKEGFYCIKENIKWREHLNIYVTNKDHKIILKNVVYGTELKKNGIFNITLERAAAEVMCHDRLCSRSEVFDYEKADYLLSYIDKTKDKYYTTANNNGRFNYSKILKKIENQKFETLKNDSKEKRDKRKDSFFALKDVKGKSYNNFKYKASRLKEPGEVFLSNNTIYDGLSDEKMDYEIVLINWIRYLYYYGDNLDHVSALYSNNLKHNLINKDEKEKPLLLSRFYRSNARNNTFVREDADFKFYQKSLKNIQDSFGKYKGNIVNIKPEHVNIEFIFENGSWRLDVFNINDEYEKYLKSI